MVLDMVDKGLLVELGGNCRLSYQRLARHFGLTVNAIKKRVNKLVEMGVIDHFSIMLNSGLRFGEGPVYFILSQVWSDAPIDEERLFGEMAQFPELGQAYLKTTRNTLLIRGHVSELPRFLQIAKFIQDLDGVIKAETELLDFISVPGKLILSQVSPILSTPRMCYNYTFTKDQLRVIRCLKDNPRMQISNIVAGTKLTPKRVQKIIKVFQQTQCIQFTFVRNLSAAGQTPAYIKITFDDAIITPKDFASWVFETFPFECWRIWSIVDNPNTIWLQISAYNVHDVEKIVQTIRLADFTADADAIVTWQVRQPDRLKLSYQKAIERLLAEHDL